MWGNCFCFDLKQHYLLINQFKRPVPKSGNISKNLKPVRVARLTRYPREFQVLLFSFAICGVASGPQQVVVPRYRSKGCPSSRKQKGESCPCLCARLPAVVEKQTRIRLPSWLHRCRLVLSLK